MDSNTQTVDPLPISHNQKSFWWHRSGILSIGVSIVSSGPVYVLQVLRCWHNFLWSPLLKGRWLHFSLGVPKGTSPSLSFRPRIRQHSHPPHVTGLEGDHHGVVSSSSLKLSQWQLPDKCQHPLIVQSRQASFKVCVGATWIPVKDAVGLGWTFESVLATGSMERPGLLDHRSYTEQITTWYYVFLLCYLLHKTCCLGLVWWLKGGKGS